MIDGSTVIIQQYSDIYLGRVIRRHGPNSFVVWVIIDLQDNRELNFQAIILDTEIHLFH